MKRGHDYSRILIWAALAVTVTRYAGAFIASDVQIIPEWLSVILSAFMGVSGLGMGVLDVLGLAYVFDGWRATMPRNGQPWPFRFKVLTVFVVSLALVGLVILTPFTVSRVRGEGMAVTLGEVALWGWSVAVNLAPLLLLGGIVIGQSGIVTVSTETPGKTPEKQQSVKVPQNAPEKPRKKWRELTEVERGQIALMETRAIVETFQVDDRLAREWREKARVNGKAH